MVENVSGERGGSIHHAFRNADAEDWRRLFLMLDDSGHGRFWKATLLDVLKTLNVVSAPAMSPREGGDAVAAPGRSPASAVDGEAGQASDPTSRKSRVVHPDLSRISEENAALRAERDRLLNQAKRHEALIAFVLKWCDRGPPHGGPGNEAVALDAIRHHPVIRAARQALTPSEEPPHA